MHIIPLAKALRSRFLRYIERLGQYLEAAGDLGRAVDGYKRGIEVDPLAEVFYQSLMRCLGQLGRRAEALDVYSRCKRNLSATLGIQPTPQTEAIYKSLSST